MSATAAQRFKHIVEALSAPGETPSAVSDTIRSLERELRDWEEMAEQLARTEERLLQVRKIFEDGPLAMAVHSADGHVLTANPALCSLLGYTAAELTGLTVHRITHPDDRSIDRSQAQRLWSGECPSYKVHKRYTRKDGRTVCARLTASVLRDEAGAPLYGLAMIEDAGELAEADQSLQTSEERWALAVRAAENAIWDWAPGSGQMDWSLQLTQMLGYAEGEVVPSVTSFDALLHPDDHAAAWHALDEHAAGRTSLCECEFRLRARDGSYRWIQSRGKAMLDDQGKVVRVTGLFAEVAARKHAHMDGVARARHASGSVDLPPSAAHCGTCRSDLLVQSRWRLWEWPMLLALHRPVRCRSCGRRAFKPLWAGVPGRPNAAPPPVA